MLGISELNSNEMIKRVFLILLLCVFAGMCSFLLPSVQSSLLPQQSFQEVVTRNEHEYLFTAFLKKFQKTYSTKDEYHKKFKNFKESISKIKELNRASQGSAKYGLTKFSDMSQKEFDMTMTMAPDRVFRASDYISGLKEEDYNVSCNKRIERNEANKLIVEWKDLPPKFDWRNKHVVGPVLYQQQCRSCYAHSVVGVMESMLMISNPTRSYQALSIQELLDCSNYTYKCDGGNTVNAMEFLCEYHLPIVTEQEYPLLNENRNCQLKTWPKSGVKVSRIIANYNVNPIRIAQLIATHGPVTANVNAHSWQFYLGGIIQYNCYNINLNHVVQIVGYDRTGPVPYFIIRNSFGADWGDAGYVYIAMSEDEYICGIGKQISALEVAVV